MKIESKPTRYAEDINFDCGRSATLTFVVRSQLFELSPPKLPTDEDALERIQTARDAIVEQAQVDGTLT